MVAAHTVDGSARSTERKAKRVDLHGRLSEKIVRKQYRTPLGIYHIKDTLSHMLSSGNFIDALLATITFLVVSTALGFYPLPIAVLCAVILFFVALYQPFLGLILYTALSFPIFMYQAPVLAWSFLFLVSAMLIYGYMHYRTIMFTYLLTVLAFSPIGYLLAIPALIFSAIIIGNKRSVFVVLLSFLLVISFSAVTGIQNSAYFAYNAAQGHTAIGNNPILQFDTGTNTGFSMGNLIPGFASTSSIFFSRQVTSLIPNAVAAIAAALGSGIATYLSQILLLIVIVIAIDWFAVTSRSKHKGAVSSMFGVIYPLSYVLLSGYSYDVSALVPLLSFILAPASLYLLESAGIGVVKALDVKKQDIRMKFGEAFEDLTSGNVNETFDDVGNYEGTKKELRDAIITPMEESGISRAYNVEPAKGILLFGPPGTGKTMLMRALANEVHAGFYYVKASNMISAFPGESERLITQMFSIAKKNAPCILFFDELDAITLSRENPSMDETHRHALSQLLVEMDGFQKTKDVIIVGATNAPNLIDPAILRPGRFDKLIFMPLPDLEGRKKILKIYLDKLPISRKVHIDKIAIMTERYSGADLKAVVESVAQIVAQDAASEHKVLEITEADILNVIRSTKPSTTLAQLEDYKKFKLDYERSIFKEGDTENTKQVTFDDIVDLSEAKKAVREAVQIPLLHPELMVKYDIKSVNGLLLFGPPGTGKTMLMRAISSEIRGVTMLELKGSEVAEAGLDKATATISEVFNRAKENAPSVIMIDEVDGLLPKREGASEVMVQITSEVLKQLDGITQMSNVVVVGATNMPDSLDPAILRPGRFDRLLFIKPPSSQGRVELLQRFLASVPCDKIDFQNLGSITKGFTGADLMEVTREAKTEAMEKELDTGTEGKVTTEMLKRLIAKTKPSAPDMVMSRYLGFLAKYGQR